MHGTAFVPPVKFVGCCKARYILGSRRQWRCLEVRMFQSINCVDSRFPVQCEQSPQQRQPLRMQTVEPVFSVRVVDGDGHSAYSRKTFSSLPFSGAHDLTRSAPGSLSQPGMAFSFGEPTISKITWAWWVSLWPGRIGFLLNISPNTQLYMSEISPEDYSIRGTYPAPHISMAVV